MMMGAGFTRNLIASSKDNRSLLKGPNDAVFKNFDTKSYQVKKKNRIIPSFKKATPEMRATIRQNLLAENERIAKIKRNILLISSAAAGACLVIILVIKF